MGTQPTGFVRPKYGYIKSADSEWLLRGGKVNGNREIAENGSLSYPDLAELALERYGMTGATLRLISEVDCALYEVSTPADACISYHPYLGRMSGQRLVLRIEDAADARLASTYSELTLLAALLRDTDLALPEPVPATNGELVPELWFDGMDRPQQCVLFRWAGISFPEKTLTQASHWQAN